MTTYELQHRFDLEVEKFGGIDPVPSHIVEDYINYAYQRYITDKYDSLINPVEKFEITERISRILAPLLKDFNTNVFTLLQTNSPYGYFCTAPIDLQYIVTENATIAYTDCNSTTQTKTCRIIPIKHNRITSNLKNPFLKPEDDEIWRVNFSDNKIELIIYDDVTLTGYTCRYIKKQTAVNLLAGTTMEIDSSVHEEVVVNAAYMLLSNLKANNTKQKENA